MGFKNNVVEIFGDLGKEDTVGDFWGHKEKWSVVEEDYCMLNITDVIRGRKLG